MICIHAKSFSLIKAKRNFPHSSILPTPACFYLIGMQKDQLPGILGLTLIPSKRDRALRGLKALSVLSDLIGPRSEKPNALAIRLTIDTYTDRDRRRGKTEARKRGPTVLEGL